MNEQNWKKQYKTKLITKKNIKRHNDVVDRYEKTTTVFPDKLLQAGTPQICQPWNNASKSNQGSTMKLKNEEGNEARPRSIQQKSNLA